MCSSFLQKRYRQQPDSLKFTSVADSPDILHAKMSYQQCSEVGRKDKPAFMTLNIKLKSQIILSMPSHRSGCTNLGGMMTCTNTLYTQMTQTLSERGSMPSISAM